MSNTFQNRGRLAVAFGNIGARTHANVRRELKRGGLAIENHAAEAIINPPKTGRIYKSKHRKGRMHQASAPGEAPAADTGRLHQSLTSVVTVDTPSHIVVETAANAPHATRLELGGSHTGPNGGVVTIEPRPYMSPAFRVNRDGIATRVRAAIIRSARGKG